MIRPTFRRQVAECLLLPMLAVLIPWATLWRLLQRFASRGSFFGVETMRATTMAAQAGFADDASAWAARHRLTRLVDQVDPALSCMRSNRWMRRHLVVTGDPMPAAPCIFAGFHYGAGFWSLRYLRQQGHRVSFLSRPIVSGDFPGERLRYSFERWRMKRAAGAGGATVIYAGGSVDKIRNALRNGTSILGMVDVPPPLSGSRVPVPFMGGEAWFPDGLSRLAASEGVPFVAYLARLDPVTGLRHLTLSRLPVNGEAPMHSLATLLENALRNDPAAWHLWAEWPLFFSNPARH